MKRIPILLDALFGLILAAISVAFFAVREHLWLLALIIPSYIVLNLFAGVLHKNAEGVRLRLLNHGAVTVCLMLFGSVVAVVYHVILLFRMWGGDLWPLFWSAVWAVASFAIPFVNGIFFMYVTSVQLGVKWRLLGVIFGLIFPVNLVVLGIMLARSFREVSFESDKLRLNASRAAERICATRYPVLLVHGFFFRDWSFFNYWGRIPKELEKNGARIYYGNHQSARPVPDAAAELARRIREIVAVNSCGKVNIIAHSKGGIDVRYAIEHLGIAPMVASLTTVSTPHRGCIFAERLLDTIPEGVQTRVAGAYNRTLRALGDENPDFIAAARDLTAGVCTPRDAYRVPDGIFTQSVGSLQKRARYGRFPMNLSYRLVRHFDGPNDGLVALTSFEFGERYTLIEPTSRRGISHADMIDLNRENIPGFDVREFYVSTVADLKRRGL